MLGKNTMCHSHSLDACRFSTCALSAPTVPAFCLKATIDCGTVDLNFTPKLAASWGEKRRLVNQTIAVPPPKKKKWFAALSSEDVNLRS